jgi:hypothetical protein
MLSIEVKQSLRDSIATKLCAHMAADLRLATCATIQAIEVRNISTLQLYTHAGEIAAKASASALAAPELDRDDIMFGTLFFATGIALLLILGGTWRVLLS